MSNPGGIIIEQDKAAKERRGKFSHLPKFSHDKTPKQEDQGKANPGVKKIKFPHMHLVMAADTQAEKSLSVQGGATKEAQKEGEKEADKEVEETGWEVAKKAVEGAKRAIKEIRDKAYNYQLAGVSSAAVGAVVAAATTLGAAPSDPVASTIKLGALGLITAGLLATTYGRGKRFGIKKIKECGWIGILDKEAKDKEVSMWDVKSSIRYMVHDVGGNFDSGKPLYAGSIYHKADKYMAGGALIPFVFVMGVIAAHEGYLSSLLLPPLAIAVVIPTLFLFSYGRGIESAAEEFIKKW